MSAVLDSSFLFAFFNENDVNNASAVKIMEKLKEGVFGKLFITDYIFDEFVTLAAKRTRTDLAIEWGELLLESQRIELLATDNAEFRAAWSLFKQYKNLSFTDCTIVSVAKHFDIANIISFDSDFDAVKGIKRVAST